MDFHLIYIVITGIFISSLVRSTFGFGDGLVGMPFFLVFLPLIDSLYIMSIVGVLYALSILFKISREFKTDNKKEFIGVTLFSIIGTVIGAIISSYDFVKFINFVLGTILILYPFIYFGIFSKIKMKYSAFTSSFFGILDGFFGGSINSNGPPLILYSQIRHWQPVTTIAFMQPIFLIGNFVTTATILCFHSFSFDYYVAIFYSIPIIYINTQIGSYIRQKIGNNLDTYFVVILFIIGLLELYKLML